MAFFIKDPALAIKKCDEVLAVDPQYVCAYGQKADIYTEIDPVKTR